MLGDAETTDRRVATDRLLDACIIGAGPAGITLARKLAKNGWVVGLFEGGGLDITAESQAMYEGGLVGMDYHPLDVARLRYFGGTSNHWAGYCLQLAHRDFEKSDHIPHSGWPIRREDLDAYAVEADEILDLSPPGGAVTDLFQDEITNFEAYAVRLSAPTRFGTKYRNEIRTAGRIVCLVNANLIGLLSGAENRIEAAVFQSYENPERFNVRARVFILCLGGIENARFLLNAGIANEHGLVGRFFADHVIFKCGNVILRHYLAEPADYTPTTEYLHNAKILNCIVRVVPDKPLDESFPALGARWLACSTDFRFMVAAALRGHEIVCPGRTGQFHVAIQTQPNPDSRVNLSNAKDRFGQRKAKLDWRLTELDFYTARRAATEFARTLVSVDAGRAQIREGVFHREAWDLNSTDYQVGFHHMGTTRMSETPQTGVVDADCRIHSVGNLYIGGSSVFPTVGSATPTYTIVQLALRLGDHLLKMHPAH